MFKFIKEKQNNFLRRNTFDRLKQPRNNILCQYYTRPVEWRQVMATEITHLQGEREWDTGLEGWWQVSATPRVPGCGACALTLHQTCTAILHGRRPSASYNSNNEGFRLLGTRYPSIFIKKLKALGRLLVYNWRLSHFVWMWLELPTVPYFLGRLLCPSFNLYTIKTGTLL